MIKAKSLFIIILFIWGGLASAKSSNNTYSHDKSDQNQALKFIELANSIKNNEKIASFIDSAEYYYRKDPIDTVLIKLLGSKYRYYKRIKDYTKAVTLCRENIALSKFIGDKEVEADFTLNIAKVYFRTKNRDSSAFYFNRALDLYSDIVANSSTVSYNIDHNIGYSHYYIGKIFYIENKYDQAIKEFYIGLRYYDKIDFKYGCLKILNNIGNTYYLNGDLDNAYIEYTKVLNQWDDIVPNKKPYTIILNIGSIYLTWQEYDSALTYYKRAYNIRKDEVSGRGARLLVNIGITYKRKKMYDSSLVYFNRAYKIFEKNNNIESMVQTKANIGLGYIEMGQYSKAEKELKYVLPKIIEFNQVKSIQETYMGLYYIYDKKKDYRTALEYYRLYTEIKDSIHSIDITNRINLYKQQFETEKKDRDISDLKQLSAIQKLENEKQDEVAKKQHLILVLLGVLAIALIAILLGLRRFYRIKRVTDLEKHKKKDEENKRKVLDLVKKQEVDSINSYMEGQEKERGRIASELHDRLGSLLSTVKLHFSSFEADMEGSKESKEGFSFALDLLDNSVQEVRTISHNLSKGILTNFGLSGAIENLRDAINTAGRIQVKYINIGDSSGISPEVEIEVFRIIQELITNAIKHSQSDKIFIQQINDSNTMNITVEDQGVGFDITKLKGKGIGLDNLRYRAENIGAIYHYETAIGQGTSVSIEINKKYQSK